MNIYIYFFFFFLGGGVGYDETVNIFRGRGIRCYF